MLNGYRWNLDWVDQVPEGFDPPIHPALRGKIRENKVSENKNLIVLVQDPITKKYKLSPDVQKDENVNTVWQTLVHMATWPETQDSLPVKNYDTFVELASDEGFEVKIKDAKEEIDEAKTSGFRIQIVPDNSGRAIAETDTRYAVLVNGKKDCELYFNTRGYNCDKSGLPLPSGGRFALPESSIGAWKKLAAQINRGDFNKEEELEVPEEIDEANIPTQLVSSNPPPFIPWSKDFTNSRDFKLPAGKTEADYNWGEDGCPPVPKEFKAKYLRSKEDPNKCKKELVN